MNRLARYTRSGTPTEDGPATVATALDPVTGLPVRIYRFAAAPVSGPGQLDHPCVPRLLEAGEDDEGGYLVTEQLRGARDLTSQPAGLDDATAAAVFETLAYLHDQEVVHGDATAHRVLRRGDDVWLAGVGVPWRPEGGPDADVRALARSLLALPGHGLSPAAQATLEAAVSEAPSAADVVRALDASDAPTSTPSARPAPTPAPAPTPPPVRAPDPAPAEAPTAAKAPAATDAQRTPAATGAPPPRFSKTPPPDVTYRSGETPLEQGRAVSTPASTTRPGRRALPRIWMLRALIAGAVVLAVLTAISQRPLPPPPAPSGPVTSIVVDVRIEPASAPPASLVIVSTPPGSRLSAGTTLGSVPRRVVFDAAGTWQVEARFQDRRSNTVTFTLPEERDVVLRFPSP